MRMMTYFPGSRSLTPAWLTTVLREAGVLRIGSVTRVTQTTMGEFFNSESSRLVVEYSDDATPNAPTHLILKRNLPVSWGVEAGLGEVDFYRRVAELPDHPPITVPCHAAASDPATGDSYLLLQDLSATHASPVTRD